MRALLLSFTLMTAPFLAQAETLSAEIGRSGIAATEARLAALPTADDANLFALGGLRFLSAVEGSLQARWQIGLADELQLVPFLRLPMPENPEPAVLAPADIATIFRQAERKLELARAPLLQVQGDFGLEINLNDLWFDVNSNGTRDADEALLAIAAPMFSGMPLPTDTAALPPLVVRFDHADTQWLAAYSHLLQALSRVILAHDPTNAIAQMQASQALMQALSINDDPDSFNAGFGRFADTGFVFLQALNQEPNQSLMAKAHDNLLQMVDHNRNFWKLVAQETDNDREWIPNDAQQTALGLDIPQGAGGAWQAILDDFEAILRGELLVPYWRVAGDTGLDVAAMFLAPRPIDLVAWIQGHGAAPYLRQGPVAAGESWLAFEEMMAGEAMLFSLFFN